jgi:hypothetical protein
MSEKWEFEPGPLAGFVPKVLRLFLAAAPRLVDPVTVTATDVDGEVIFRCSVIRSKPGSYKAEVPFPNERLRPPLRVVIEDANGDSITDTITATDLKYAYQ